LNGAIRHRGAIAIGEGERGEQRVGGAPIEMGRSSKRELVVNIIKYLAIEEGRKRR
jgi:hypothetical protein